MQTLTAPTPKTNGSVQTNKTIMQTNNNPVFYVFKTTDYSLFKKMGDNRNLNLLHVKRLVESFNEKHLVCPIIVNEKMEVIDGQHRLQASKDTGVPVYYFIVPGYGIQEVQKFNTNQKNWTKLDFLTMYCAEGKRAYLEFEKFMNDFPDFQMQSSERILTGKLGGGKAGKIGGLRGKMRDFEEGKLVIPNINKSYCNARRLMEFKPFYLNFHRGTFVSSVLPLFESKKYNHKEMIHKLGNCPIKLTDCVSTEAYRMLLEDIYNYKRLRENKVSFRHE